MISSINYQEIEALFILVVVGEAWKVMVVSREIVSVPVISADHRSGGAFRAAVHFPTDHVT